MAAALAAAAVLPATVLCGCQTKETDQEAEVYTGGGGDGSKRTVLSKGGQPYKARVVPISDRSSFPGPEVKSAVCLSGGGMKALSFSTGVLRGLHAIGVMDKVDAISSISGGSWAGGVYMFARVNSIDELLGPQTTPGELDMKTLSQSSSRIGRVAEADLLTAQRAKLSDPSVKKDEAWQLTVEEAMATENIPEHDYLAGSQDQLDSIVKRNPDLDPARILVPAADRPSVWVATGTLLAPKGGYVSNPDNTVQLHMGPDFVGVPFRPEGSGVSYPPRPGTQKEPVNDRFVGGGFVETFAFGGPAPTGTAQAGDCGGSCEVPTQKRRPWRLGDLMGVSGAGYAIPTANNKEPRKISLRASESGNAPDVNYPTATYWPILRDGDGRVPNAARDHSVGDGTFVDNTGLLAMLQRGAKKIIVVIAAEVGLTADVQDGDYETVTKDLLDKFGYGDDNVFFRSKNQVFSQDDFFPLVKELQQLVQDGKPAVVRRPSMQVLDNSWWGISTYIVDIAFVCLQQSANFEGALPDDTRQALQESVGTDRAFGGRRPWRPQEGKDVSDEEDPDKPFKSFPFYQLLFQNGVKGFLSLTRPQVNLLAAQGEYTVKENRKELEALLG